MSDAIDQAKNSQSDGATSGAGHSRSVVDIFDKETDDCGEVWRIPFARHVCFGEADIRSQDDATEEIFVAHFNLGGWIFGIYVAEGDGVAFR